MTCTASVPSRSSRHGGASRTTAPIAISIGAVDTMPSASAADQTRQMLNRGAVDGPSRVIIIAEPAPTTAGATPAAANSATTCPSLSSLKVGPDQCLINQTASTASLTLQIANADAPKILV